ncbi:hypothetical protein HK105_204348 [Polyrhizophydium stewartii]|uniref:NADH dehydrogenase [ubiquinone] 1 alpha subcomplex subunit 11 n=1 Tax=Polyrhizophydium stewartii TaxID=2732419 RepID=A0ABR4N9S8_9FUNG
MTQNEGTRLIGPHNSVEKPLQALSHFVLPRSPLEASVILDSGKIGIVGAVSGAVFARAFGWWINSPRHILRRELVAQTGLLGGLSALFGASTILAAKFRGVDDSFNYGIGGATAGFVKGMIRKSVPMALGQAALLGVGLTALTAGFESAVEAQRLPANERNKIAGNGYSAIPRPDPFAARIEEMQARESSAGN